MAAGRTDDAAGHVHTLAAGGGVAEMGAIVGVMAAMAQQMEDGPSRPRALQAEA
jgi:hypothetical protein